MKRKKVRIENSVWLLPWENLFYSSPSSPQTGWKKKKGERQQIWKQPKCPSKDEWLKKMQCIYNEILFRHKKEVIPIICDNMDRP